MLNVEEVEKSIEHKVDEEVPPEVEEVEQEKPPVVEEHPAVKPEEYTKTSKEYDEKSVDDDYTCVPTKKGYCVIRERTKKVFGVKYDAEEHINMTQKHKAKILDYDHVLPKKTDPERKRKLKLL